MFKWLLGAMGGGPVVDFFDPQHGQQRRDEAMGWISNLLEQSPDRLQGFSQAAQDQLQGLSSNVSQRVSQMRTGSTSGMGSNNM